MKLAALGSEISSFGTALRRYSQVILALLRREEENRRHAPLASIIQILEPITLICAISLLYWLLDRRHAPVGNSPVLFFTTGLFPKFFFLHVSQRMKGLSGRNYPIEQWLDYIIVHIMLKFIDYLILGIVLFGLISIFVTSAAIPFNIFPIVEAMGYLVMLGFGWGVCIIVLTKGFGFPKFIFRGLNMLLILLSGALFVVDFLPYHVRHTLSYNPILHALILFRQGFYPNYPSLTLDLDYLRYSAFVAVVLGLLLERSTRRRLLNK